MQPSNARPADATAAPAWASTPSAITALTTRVEAHRRLSPFAGLRPWLPPVNVHRNDKRNMLLKAPNARVADAEAAAGGNAAPHATGQRQATKRSQRRLMAVGENGHVKGSI